MLLVLGNLFFALIGVATGFAFFERHRQSLSALLHAVRLVLDYNYFAKTYRDITFEATYQRMAQLYNLPEQAEHAEVLRDTEAQTHRSIRYQAGALARQLVKRLVLLALVPLAVALLFDKVFLVAAGVLLAIVAMTALSNFRTLGAGQTTQSHQECILQHAYAVRGRPLQRLSYSTPPSNSMITAPILWLKPPKLRMTIPDISVRTFKQQLKGMPSWQNAWWGADIALSTLLVAHYWWSNALSDTTVHVMLLTLALIGFVQLFFIPMWFIIRLCQKLIAAERPRRITPHH